MSDHEPDAEDFINPWRQFVGCWVPNWLLEREELSLGAKVTYARLAQFAGRKGHTIVDRPELAQRLASSERSVGTYTAELVEHRLIYAKRRGQGNPNEYWFLRHPWMLDALELPDRQDLPIKSGKNCPPDRQELPITPIEERRKKRERRTAAVSAVYEAWKTGTDRNGGTKLTEQRRSKINARLEDGYTVEQLVAVVTRGWRADPWPERVHQNDLAILLRDGGQVEKFLELADRAKQPAVSERARALALTQAKLARSGRPLPNGVRHA